MEDLMPAKREGIQHAAALVRGTMLNRLELICETQKTVSTSVVAREIERLREHLRIHGIVMRGLSDRI